jgi:hypothetical protein
MDANCVFASNLKPLSRRLYIDGPDWCFVMSPRLAVVVIAFYRVRVKIIVMAKSYALLKKFNCHLFLADFESIIIRGTKTFCQRGAKVDIVATPPFLVVL